VVTRLCAPIEGTDPARLADCLGLDPSRFRGASGGGAAADAREDALVSGSAYFDDEDRFKVCCTCFISAHPCTFVSQGEWLLCILHLSSSSMPASKRDSYVNACLDAQHIVAQDAEHGNPLWSGLRAAYADGRGWHRLCLPGRPRAAEALNRSGDCSAARSRRRRCRYERVHRAAVQNISYQCMLREPTRIALRPQANNGVQAGRLHRRA